MFDFLSQKFSGVLGWLKDRGRLTDENIQESITQVREALLEADVPREIVENFLDEIRADVVGKKVQQSLNPGQQMIKIVHDKLLAFLGGNTAFSPVSLPIPSVVMVMGLQGSGKTTSCIKVAKWIKQQAKQRGKVRRILVGSIDYYRPAAIDQLEILAHQDEIAFYRSKAQSAIAAASDIYQEFKRGGYEFLILDTAGRLHIDQDMMQELVIINKQLAPRHKFLVLDAMTGQESLNVAQTFDKALGFDSAILTKIDSDTRGGAAFSFRYALKKPISFVGTGEKSGDIESFVPERMATRILGMGDILTLIEKAGENISQDEQEKMSRRLLDGSFSLKDFADQLNLIDKMGSLQKITRYLPNMHQVTPDMMDKGQVEIKRFKAIISSMTLKEQVYPDSIDGSRKKRIALGSGTNVQDVNQLLQRFEQSKQFVKMFKKAGKTRKFFR